MMILRIVIFLPVWLGGAYAWGWLCAGSPIVAFVGGMIWGAFVVWLFWLETLKKIVSRWY